MSLFGTFGYEEVGLFEEYEAQNPGITIRYESTQDEDKYWPALQTRLASGSGVADVQGIEVARIADVVTNQADKWTDLRDDPRGRRDRPLHRLEGGGRDHARRRGARPRHRHRPDGHLLPQRPARRRPACPPTPRSSPRRCPTGTATSPSARSTRPRPRPAPRGTTPRAGSTTRSSPASRDLLRRLGQAGLRDQPGRPPGVRHRRRAGAGGPDRQARAVRRPRVGPGLRLRPLRHDRLPVLDDRLHQGQGRRRGRGQVERHGAARRRRRQLGRLRTSASPPASQHKERGREADRLADRARAAGQGLRRRSATSRRRPQAIAQVAGTTDPYFNGAPIGQIFSKSATAAPVQILGPQDGVVKNAMTPGPARRSRPAAPRRRTPGPTPARRSTTRSADDASTPHPVARPAAGEPLPRRPGHPPTAPWRSRLHAAEARTAPYAYVAPFFVIFVAFGLFPLVYTAWISLHRYRLGSRMSWVGPGQLRLALLATRPSTTRCGRRSRSACCRPSRSSRSPWAWPTCSTTGCAARTFLRVAMLMPYATSVAAATLVFALLFGRDNGLVNWLLGVVGIDPVDWRNGDWTAQIAISVIVIWRWTGYNALIYLAGMQSIPTGPVRGGGDRRREPVAAVHPRHAAGAAPDDPVHGRRLDDRAPASSSASPCCSAAARPTAGRRTSTRRSGCSCTSRAGSSQLGRAATVAWVMFVLILGLVLLNAWLARADGGLRWPVLSLPLTAAAAHPAPRGRTPQARRPYLILGATRCCSSRPSTTCSSRPAGR